VKYRKTYSKNFGNIIIGNKEFRRRHMELTDKEKWDAVVKCDSSYDGRFFYGVKTTGVFCRPSCKSTEPLRDNVEFFDGIVHAYEYGLRPCKRCRPDLNEYKPMKELAEKAKKFFDACFDDPKKLSLEMKNLGISQNRLIHLFSHQFNSTPLQYVNRLRVNKAVTLLKDSDETILNIAMLCGYGSLSCFYDVFKKQTGSAPGEYKKIISEDSWR